VGRHGRQHQQGHRASDRALRLRHVAYQAAWLYMCAWIAALSLGRLPHALEVASVALALAAVLLIVVVLIEPRPMRAGAPRAALDVPPPAGRWRSAGWRTGDYVTQISAIGPLGLDYVDPRDDPRVG
jgi:hypothetical protein